MRKEIKTRDYGDRYESDYHPKRIKEQDCKRSRKKIKSNLRHLAETGFNFDLDPDLDDMQFELLD